MKVFGNAIIVTMNENRDIFRPGYICIEGDKIVEVGPMTKCKYDFEDLENAIITPGFINGHTHLSLVYLRSMADDMADRLKKFLFPVESNMFDVDIVTSGAEMAAYESLKNGTTTVVDMYYFAKDLAKLYERLGIRGFVGQTLIQNHALTKDLTAKYLEEFILEYKDNPMVKPMITPHAPYSINDDDIKMINHLSQKYDILKMMHIAEMDFEMEQYSPFTPFEYAYEKGLIDENFIGVHGIHTSEIDFEIMKKAGSSMVCCPGANMKAGKGIPDIFGFIDSDITTMLGTDGPVSGNTLDLMSVMKLTGYSQKTRYHNRELMPASRILEMVTIEAAKILRLEDVGSLITGYQADLNIISTKKNNINPIYDVYSSIVYGLQTQNIDKVYVAGKKLVDGGEIVDSKSYERAKERFNINYEKFLEFYLGEMDRF